MSEQSPNNADSEKKAERYLIQRKYEDQLLYTRTGVVLTMNGLAAIAVGLEGIPPSCRLCIAVIVLIVNILWLFCSIEGAHFIINFRDEIENQNLLKYLPEEKLRVDFLRNRPLSKLMRNIKLSPTTVMGWWLPSLLTLGWILGLIIS